MFIAVRKEPNGFIYIDKNIYLRTETLKFTLADYEAFKKQNPNIEYTYGEAKESVERQHTFINEETGKEETKTIIELIDYIYVTKRLFTDEELSQPPYNYTKVEVDSIYSDCESSDFNEDLTFSPGKYIDRKQREKDAIRIPEIKARLSELSQDLIQAQAGAVFDDLEDRKLEFQTLHNELRILLGKLPRVYETQDNQKSVEE